MNLEKMEEEVPNGWDEHFCFNIIDFTPGSAIIVTRNGARERGVVTSAEYNQFATHSKCTVNYKTKDGSKYSADINSIVLLQDGSKSWLSSRT